MKRQNIVSFIIERYDLSYYEADFRQMLAEARYLGYNSQEVVLHITPIRGTTQYRVDIGGLNVEIHIKDEYVEILNLYNNGNYIIYFNNMI